jgi:2-polyprenyl-3-methyl-5-hydroxy-6-metoxy-1,4-benzoquinol methylase
MTPLSRRVLGALQRLNAAYPWDHNAHYHRWILRQLPRRFGSALDVGCGSGDLARLLATRAEAVTAIDVDPAIVERARQATPASAPVTYTTADALTGIPEGRTYDVITCVAALHHMPFEDAVPVLRRHLAPGGTLVVVGVYRRSTMSDCLIDLAAVPLNPATGWLKNRGRTSPFPASMTAVTRPPSMTFTETVLGARDLLPGARLRRMLFWRYTLVWRNDR